MVWNIFIFPYIWNSHPNWLIVSEGFKPPAGFVSFCILHFHEAWRRLTSKTVVGDKVSKAMPTGYRGQCADLRCTHVFAFLFVHVCFFFSMTTSKQDSVWSWLLMFLGDSVMSWAETNLLQATCIVHCKELDGQAGRTVTVYRKWANVFQGLQFLEDVLQVLLGMFLARTPGITMHH